MNNANDIRAMKRSRRARGPGLTAKGDERKFVEHNYVDHGDENELSDGCKDDYDHEMLQRYRQYASNIAKEGLCGKNKCGPFPFRFHMILSEIENEGKGHIISWLSHGRSFAIHKQGLFQTEIMPKYFKQSKITSFHRQLNLYGFQRLTRGRDCGSYYHEYFLRGKPFLTRKIIRTKVKGTKIRAASSPDDEPNFYAIPPIKGDVFALGNRLSNYGVASSMPPPTDDEEEVKRGGGLLDRHVNGIGATTTNHAPSVFRTSRGTIPTGSSIEDATRLITTSACSRRDPPAGGGGAGCTTTMNFSGSSLLSSSPHPGVGAARSLLGISDRFLYCDAPPLPLVHDPSSILTRQHWTNNNNNTNLYSGAATTINNSGGAAAALLLQQHRRLQQSTDDALVRMALTNHARRLEQEAAVSTILGHDDHRHKYGTTSSISGGACGSADATSSYGGPGPGGGVPSSSSSLFNPNLDDNVTSTILESTPVSAADNASSSAGRGAAQQALLRSSDLEMRHQYYHPSIVGLRHDPQHASLPRILSAANERGGSAAPGDSSGASILEASQFLNQEQRGIRDPPLTSRGISNDILAGSSLYSQIYHPHRMLTSSITTPLPPYSSISRSHFSNANTLPSSSPGGLLDYGRTNMFIGGGMNSSTNSGIVTAAALRSLNDNGFVPSSSSYTTRNGGERDHTTNCSELTRTTRENEINKRLLPRSPLLLDTNRPRTMNRISGGGSTSSKKTGHDRGDNIGEIGESNGNNLPRGDDNQQGQEESSNVRITSSTHGDDGASASCCSDAVKGNIST